MLQKLRANNSMDTEMRPTSPAAQIACNRDISFEALSFEICRNSATSVVSEPCAEQSSVVTEVDDIHSISSIQPDSISSVNASDCDKEIMNPAHAFQESLALAFIKRNLTHTQENMILKTLRSLPYLAYLPRDTRTLLGTPRVGSQVRSIDPGEYLHIGFQKSLTRILQKIPYHLIPDVFEID